MRHCWPDEQPDDYLVSPAACVSRSQDAVVHARDLWRAGIERNSRRGPATAKYDPDSGMARGYAAHVSKAKAFIEAYTTAFRIRELADAITKDESFNDVEIMRAWVRSLKQPTRAVG